ncbi:hypothetical protein PPYR_14547 [Photinus pyralis]|uniref:MD-2-related lipid-recognition domain-containing protein n=1 Tax=Photinus pyralis TaxID=7054 RepID=A0A5N4A5P3_PHOPY|nr:uncharacterized protein LOC116180010 [Photinus pyralis]KAB0792588.1 hypothetical protein PPYR_14547 [Photinus pyralis]
MYAIFLLFASLGFVMAQFHQDTYVIEHDRIEILKFNRSFVRRPDFQVLYFNDTVKMKALNASGYFIAPIQNKVKMEVTVYRFVGGAYRVFPINVTLDGCNENKRNLFGLQSIYQYTNFKGCPVPIGYLYLKYYLIEYEKFPPHVPYGKYKLFMEVHANEGAYFIGNGNWYGSIVPKRKD